MRDIVVSIILVALMPACFRRPFIGLTVFTWLAYMRLQDLAWGWARFVRWSYYVAVLTIAGFLFHSRQRWFLPDIRCWIMIALAALFGIGMLFAEGIDKWEFQRYLEFDKIVFVALFTTAVVDSKDRLRVLVWVIALSFGFYGTKYGVWGILSGGAQILQGPGGLLADNNDFGLAMAMAVPMLFHLGWSEKREVLRRAFWLALPLTVITVGLTRSRGAFLAVSVALAILVWRSRNRLLGLAVGLMVAIAAYIVAPQEYKDRLVTIVEYEEEGSATGRLRAWGVATRMAMDHPFFGVGFANFRQHFLQYAPNPTPGELDGSELIVAHSSYFQIWAEGGTPALLLYLSLIVLSFVSVWRVRALARRRFHTSWMLNYATMFEASMAAFVVGSAFLNRAHFDLFYQWVAIIAVFERLAMREMADELAYPLRGEGRGELRAVRTTAFPPRPAQGRFGGRPALPGRV